MSIWQSALKLQLGLVVGLSGWLLLAISPSWSRDSQIPGMASRQTVITSDALAQSNRARINSVRLETTAAGISVVLETAAGKLTLPNALTQDKISYTDIPNAVLALPDGKEFRVENPATGIASIAVTQVTPDFVRVLITGTEVAPTAQITTTDRGLTISSTPVEPTAQAGNEPEIEINVIGLRNQRGYKLPNATTATKTDTPIKDIPQSIQIVPPEVLRDRNVKTVSESLETVSGTARGNNSYNLPITSKIIRGFDQASTTVVNFRDGFPDGDFYTVTPIDTIEQVEVLKGPASVLFGAGEPGGIVNTVTKKPLSKPSYKVGFEVGNYGLYKPSIDFSGLLNADKTALYRFNASYQGAGDFQGFADTKLTTIAPSVALKLGDKTNLNLYYEYTSIFANPPGGISTGAILSDGSLTPRSLYTQYPSLSLVDTKSHRFGYSVKHEFNDNLQLRNNISVNLTGFKENVGGGFILTNDLFLDGEAAYRGVYQRNNFFGQIDLLGKFNTGSIPHQVLAGVDFNRSTLKNDRVFSDTFVPSLDIRNPNYNIPSLAFSTLLPFSSTDIDRKSYGIYVQDQIAFTDRLKFLIGGRYDWVSTDTKGDFNTGGEVIALPTRNDGAFSPRVGLVYQPTKDVSLYASYTQSFAPISGFSNLSTDPNVSFAPSKGTQYEVGVKTDLLEGKLSATLAAYQLTKTNILTPDPANRLRSIQTGEQQSKGIELDVTGEILPGWEVTTGYALTDARVTADNNTPIGNRLANVPNNQASLWTKYTLKEGNLKGLGFGLGLFYVGSRQGDLANSFTLRDYLRTDAAIYYQQPDGLKASLNFRNLFNIDAVAYSIASAEIQRTEPFTVSASVGWEF